MDAADRKRLKQVMADAAAAGPGATSPSTAAKAAPSPAKSKGPKDSNANKHWKKWAAAALLLLLLFGLGTFLYANRKDPVIADTRSLDEKLRDKSLPNEERDELMRQKRDNFQNMTDDQKFVYGMERMRERDPDMVKRMEEQRKKSAAEQKKDRRARIEREEKWAKEREARAKNGGGQNGRGGNGQGGNGQAGANGQNANPQDSEHGKRSRDERRRMMLDYTSPEGRALRAEHRIDMNLERQAMGLPVRLNQGGRGGFGGWFGGFGGPGRGGPPPGGFGGPPPAPPPTPAPVAPQ